MDYLQVLGSIVVVLVLVRCGWLLAESAHVRRPLPVRSPILRRHPRRTPRSWA